jgi:Zn-dependent membrane protease YugP
MFGSLTLTLDKSVLIALVAVGVAISASSILKNSLERLINGNITHKDTHARKKGAILTIIALTLLAGSVIAILESVELTAFLAQHVKLYKKVVTPEQ